ncbi:hypothetical protein C0J52_17101 [Blattella germanica]|nr:hypothetical protein C0J52_17101 [Blattella germanica]
MSTGCSKKVSNILRGGSTHRNKKKKSHIPWSRNAYFLSYVLLFRATKDVRHGNLILSATCTLEMLNVTSVHCNASLCPLQIDRSQRQ